MLLTVLLVLCLFTGALASDSSRIISPEFRNVTYYSTVRLSHAVTGYYLHSHSVMYGSGSGSQSITGYKDADDPNDDFSILAGIGQSPSFRGSVIPCGSIIQLFHTPTRRYLHSNSKFESPISRRQEVSCNEGQDEGNNWAVECDGSSWIRDVPVKLRHVKTNKYLTMVKSNAYGNPIQGQLEVYCDSLAQGTKAQQWISSEGIYYSTVRDEL